VRGELADVERQASRRGLDPSRAVAKIRTRLRDWQDALHEKTLEARQVLRALLADRLRVTSEAGGGWRFEGEGKMSALVAGGVSSDVQAGR
jgi:hypothetical protein